MKLIFLYYRQRLWIFLSLCHLTDRDPSYRLHLKMTILVNPARARDLCTPSFWLKYHQSLHSY